MTDLTGYAGRTVLRHGRERDRRIVARPALLTAACDVVALVRDDDPQSEFVRSGDERRVTRVHGSLEDLALLERLLVEYEVDTVFHLGAQTQVRHAQRQPLATFETNVRGTWNLLEAVRRVAPQVAGAGRRLERQGLRRERDAALHGGASAGRPATSTTRRKSVRRPDDVRRTRHSLRPAGRRSPAAATSTAAAT